MVKVHTENEFVKRTGRKFEGFYMDGTLKDNVDNYLIKAVDNKFDGVMCFSGIEGSGKTTLATTVAKYCDPSFPGPLLNDGTQRRKCTRIVYTGKQIMHAIDTAQPKQAIVIDEAVLALSASDYATDIQKILLKKFVLIRKKKLFIFIVIPSIFMLRKYFAIFRTRALIHTTVRDGIHRGTFKLYSYDTKRMLYLKGMKEFDQNSVRPDFTGSFTDTSGFFFDPEEYEEKKDAAINELTSEPEKKKKEMSATRKRIFTQRNDLAYLTYRVYLRRTGQTEDRHSMAKFVAFMKEHMKWDDLRPEFVWQAIRETTAKLGEVDISSFD